MVTTIQAKDGTGATIQLAVVDDGTGVLNTVHAENATQRAALLASLAPLATAANQTAGTNAVVAAVQATSTATQPVAVQGSVAVTGTFFPTTQPVSLATLPLPTGAATDASLAALKTAIGNPLQAGGAVTISNTPAVTVAGVATDAKVEAVRALLAGTLAVSGPLTAAQLTSAALAGAAQLPASLGSKTAANSLPVTLATDGQFVTMQTAANASLSAIQTSVAGTLRADTVVQATSTSRSTTAGTIASVLMPANATRRGFVIQNQSTSANIYINGLATATADSNSLVVAPGAYYETQVHHVGTGAISIIATAANTPVYAREF